MRPPATWSDSFFLSTQPTSTPAPSCSGRVHTAASRPRQVHAASRPRTRLVAGQLLRDRLADSKGLVPDVNRANNVRPRQIPFTSRFLARRLADGLGHDRQRPGPLLPDHGAGRSGPRDRRSFAALQGGELYVGYQSVPTTSTFVASSTSATQTTQQVVIPDTQAGTYYFLLQGDTGSGRRQPFSSAQLLPLTVTGVSPNNGG